MLTTVILLSILLLFFVFFQMMLRGFKNPQRKHTRTPDSIGIDFKEISIPTQNNRKLYGWLMIKNPAKPIIILVHGWGRNVERMMPYIEQLNKSDYNLITFDSRHHGNSERDEYSTMKKFAEDIYATLDFLDDLDEISNRQYAVIGLSIGGAASIYAAAHDERIKSVITVGALANPYDVMRLQLKNNHIPYQPMGWLVMSYVENKVGFKFGDIAPEKHIGNSDAQFLLIHGDKDLTIPLSHVHRLQKAGKQENIKTWILPGRGHSDCHKEETYWTEISKFLEATFNNTFTRQEIRNFAGRKNPSK